jgi:tetratricopeptide (TPR) repeat protein
MNTPFARFPAFSLNTRLLNRTDTRENWNNQSKMTPEQHQSLTDQFDQLKGEMPIEGPYSAGTEEGREWELLKLAVDAVQLYAITEQVRLGRMKFELEQRELELAQADNRPAASPEVSPAAPLQIGKMADMVDARRSSGSPAAVPVIRRRMSPVLQIAAILMVVIVSTAVIKVANTRPEGVFENNYSAYQLSVTRGADVSDPLEQAYRSGNWAGVYSTYKATHNKTQKDYFLTAMAHMQQREYYEAISLLKALIQCNQTGEPYFEDEAEYYLAMNYLATGQSIRAVELFDKIKADPRHLYHSRVMQMSKLDLGILRVK